MRPTSLCPLVLLACYLLPTESSPGFARESRGGKVRLCGVKLLNVVGKLCNNCVKITGPTNKIPLKRGDVSTYDDTESGWPWHPSKRWSGGTGINACCLRGCSMSQLQQMCCKPGDPACSCSSQ